MPLRSHVRRTVMMSTCYSKTGTILLYSALRVLISYKCAQQENITTGECGP